MLPVSCFWRACSWPSWFDSEPMLGSALDDIGSSVAPAVAASSVAKPSRNRAVRRGLEVIVCAYGVSCRARAGTRYATIRSRFAPRDDVGSPVPPPASAGFGGETLSGRVFERPQASGTLILRARADRPRASDSRARALDSGRLRPHLRRRLARGAARRRSGAARVRRPRACRGTGSSAPTARWPRASASAGCSRPRACRSAASASTCESPGCPELLMWVQREIRLEPRPRGFHLVTREVLERAARARASSRSACCTC